MDITVTGDLIIPGHGAFAPGDKISVNEGTGKAIVENRGALEGHVSKTVFKKEMKAKAALRDAAIAEYEEREPAAPAGDDEGVDDGDAHAADAEDMA